MEGGVFGEETGAGGADEGVADVGEDEGWFVRGVGDYAYS